MKIVVATCFESNEERARLVYETCQSNGYEVKVMTSDFSHIKKKQRQQIPQEFIAIHAQVYKRNLSIERMISHHKFAKALFQKLEQENPDLLWLMAPANSLIKEMSAYKKKHPSVKVILDMIDMWPESLPLQMNKYLFPLNLWRNLRKKHINEADYLITECSLYQEILKKEYKGRIKTIYWSRDAKAIREDASFPDDMISLCYIGSINNIIDIDQIALLVSSADKPVIVHVIGDGESKDQMIHCLEKFCTVQYYGEVRDEKRKSEIFQKCHAGINIYRDGLYIGLTVKCIDYFQHGLPIINNIKEDTWNLVEQYGAGINVSSDITLKYSDLTKMRLHNQHIYDLYEKNFSKEIFSESCMQVIDEVMR